MKCQVCKKNVGLMIFDCNHCRIKTCIKCRYANSHDCKRDFISENKDILIKRNPVIVADKIENRL